MSQDIYDKAVKWVLEQPELQQVMWNTYVTYDTQNDARRFSESGEFKETLRILSRLGRGPHKNYWLLDAGSGNGVASYAFAKAGYDVVSVDSCPGEIAGTEAAKKLNGLDGANFEVSPTDIRNLAASAEQFDVIYGRQFFHHVRDLNGVVTYLAKLLKPGGILCAVREHVVRNEKLREEFLANHPLHHITQSEGAYYLKEYRGAIRWAGLAVLIELYPFASVINTRTTDMDGIWQKVEDRFPDSLCRIIKGKRDSALLWRLIAWHLSHRTAQLYSFFAKRRG